MRPTMARSIAISAPSSAAAVAMVALPPGARTVQWRTSSRDTARTPERQPAGQLEAVEHQHAGAARRAAARAGGHRAASRRR